MASGKRASPSGNRDQAHVVAPGCRQCPRRTVALASTSSCRDCRKGLKASVRSSCALTSALVVADNADPACVLRRDRASVTSGARTPERGSVAGGIPARSTVHVTPSNGMRRRELDGHGS
jgi:hypothetical protein